MITVVQSQFFRQLTKFSAVGIVNTGIDWAAYLALTRLSFWWGEHYLYAKVVAFLVAVTNSYILNRLWTFTSKEPIGGQFFRFLFTSLVGLYLNTYILLLAVEKFHLADIIGLAAASIFVLGWNFMASRLWVFKQRLIVTNE